MNSARISSADAAFVLAFSLALSTSGIKTFSMLSGQAFPLTFYLVVGIASVATFSIFLGLFAAFRAWVRNAARQPG